MLLKKFTVIIAILVSLILTVGCSPRTTSVNSEMNLEDVERLPEDQKDTELDKKLKEIRKFRRDNKKIENGSWISRSYSGAVVPGYIENSNEYSQEELESVFETAEDYIINELKIPKRGEYEYDYAESMDPRINKIYEDENKGVANGYDNENIFVVEYETKKENVYSYLFIVRDSKDSAWKIIYDGTSYKQE
jgi:hypothetical protein